MSGKGLCKDDADESEECSSLLVQEKDEDLEDSMNPFKQNTNLTNDLKILPGLDLDRTDHSQSSTMAQASQSQSVLDSRSSSGREDTRNSHDFTHPKVRVRISADLDQTDHSQSSMMVRRDVSRSSIRSQSHSGLADIDTTFTPYKKKDSKAMPKMKIFLPKDEDTSSSEDENSSLQTSKEEDEEPENGALKKTASFKRFLTKKNY